MNMPGKRARRRQSTARHEDLFAAMNYFRHLEACNRFDPERFLPLLVAGRRVGFVRRDNVLLLAAFPRLFLLTADAVAIADTSSRS